MNTTPFEKKEKVKMIAHRGVSGLEFENTCAAFVVAGVKSYYGIETDVHVTKDGKFILVHDDNLKYVAGLNEIVEECTFEYLRGVTLKDSEGNLLRKDLCMPTLEEYFSICKRYEKQAILELKNPMSEEKICEIVQIGKEMGCYERTTFISFTGENLVALRKHYPDADVQFLDEDPTEKTIEFCFANNFGGDFEGKYITKEIVSRFHQRGLVVNCWTVDCLELAEKLKTMGIDMITTNILE